MSLTTTSAGRYVDTIIDLCDVCEQAFAVAAHHAVVNRRPMPTWTDREILDDLALEYASDRERCVELHGRVTEVLHADERRP